MLVLFDIDGTLLLTDGAGSKAMLEAGRRLVGDHFSFDGVDIAGRIDPVIWADAAAANGVRDAEEQHAAFRAEYAAILADRLEVDPTALALPGVRALVDRLKAAEGVTLGLLTGNYPETGRLKIAAAGLVADDFPVAAWGSDGLDRRDLPVVAMERYRSYVSEPIEPEQVVIIGDTPHDIDCARAAGCRVLAVATGPAYSLAELEEHGPDRAVADLTATADLVAWILSPNATVGFA